MFLYTDPMLGGLIIFYIIGIIVALGIQIALGVWVYKDAEKNGENGTLWLIVVLVAGCMGLIIYLIVRSQNN